MRGKKPWNKSKGGVQEGLVSSVADDGLADIVMHTLAWIGAIDLSDQQVQKIKSDFKCWLCRMNTHSWPTCPHLAKWEIKTGFIVSQMQDKVGISDLLFLAYHAMKRESGGKPVKPYDAWCETVSEVTVGEDQSPKATPSEA
jgi:hypothetical protein